MMQRLRRFDASLGLILEEAARTELSQLNSLVAETPGAILADEYMGMLTLEGRPLVIQPFEVTQLAWAGKWDQTPLLESIRKKEYRAPERAVTAKVDACPGDLWRLPSDGSLGIGWRNSGIDFFGQRREASIPVYSVAMVH